MECLDDDSEGVTVRYEAVVNTEAQIQVCWVITRVNGHIIARNAIYSVTWTFCEEYFRDHRANSNTPSLKRHATRWLTVEEFQTLLPATVAEVQAFERQIIRQYEQFTEDVARYGQELWDREEREGQ